MPDLPIDSIIVGERFRKDLGDLSSLKASIAAVGLLHPVVVTADGKLVAGRRRLEACSQMGWEEVPAIIVDLGDPEEAERDENQERLNLTSSEMVAVRRYFESEEREAAKDRQREHGGTAPGRPANTGGKLPPVKEKTRDALAARAGTSGRTLDKATAVVDAADKDPDRYAPLVDEMDRTGKVDLAFRKLKQYQLREAREKAAAEAPIETLGIETGDFREIGGIVADESVDLLFTDPPYASFGVEMLPDLAEFAVRTLKPGGVCLVYSGQYYLPEVYATLTASDSLCYMWTFCVRHDGPNQRFRKYALHVGWKPVVALYRPPLSVWWEPVCDVLAGRLEKELHDWQQGEPEAAQLVRSFCPTGGLVCDPFCGSGTALAAAKSLDMRYIGFEIDPDVAAQARKRLAE